MVSPMADIGEETSRVKVNEKLILNRFMNAQKFISLLKDDETYADLLFNVNTPMPSASRVSLNSFERSAKIPSCAAR